MRHLKWIKTYEKEIAFVFSFLNILILCLGLILIQKTIVNLDSIKASRIESDHARIYSSMLIGPEKSSGKPAILSLGGTGGLNDEGIPACIQMTTSEVGGWVHIITNKETKDGYIILHDGKCPGYQFPSTSQ